MTVTTDIYDTPHDLRGVSIDSGHQPKLRADVRRNFYDDQCYARLEAWTTEKGWTLIRNLPIKGTAIFRHHSVEPGMGRDEWRVAMQSDLDWLLDFGRQFYKDTA